MIHLWFTSGWVYNVSGLQAVELKLHNGRIPRIDPDDLERLARAIANPLAKRREDG
jgi:hypothetical protein